MTEANLIEIAKNCFISIMDYAQTSIEDITEGNEPIAMQFKRAHDDISDELDRLRFAIHKHWTDPEKDEPVNDDR